MCRKLLFLLFSLSIQAAPLKIGVMENDQPFSWIENGKPKGLLVEVWKEITKHTAQPFEYVPLTTAEVSKKTPKAMDMDLILGGFPLNEWTDAYYSHPFFLEGFAFLIQSQQISLWDTFQSNVTSLPMELVWITLVCLLLTAIVLHYTIFRFEPQLETQSAPMKLLHSVWSMFTLGVGVGSIYYVHRSTSKYAVFPWLIISYIFFTIVSGIIGASFVIDSMSHRIYSLDDINHKIFTVLRHEFPQEARILEYGGYLVRCNTIQEAIAQVKDQKVTGFAARLSVLDAYLEKHPKEAWNVIPFTLKRSLLSVISFKSPSTVYTFNQEVLRLKKGNIFEAKCADFFGSYGVKQCIA